MSEADLHSWATWTEMILAGVAAIALVFVAAPYGRHDRSGWGPTIPNRAAWLVMELPAVVLFAAIHLMGDNRWATVPLVFAGMWQFHYIQRTFVFPFRIHTGGTQQVAHHEIRRRSFTDIVNFTAGYIHDTADIVI